METLKKQLLCRCIFFFTCLLVLYNQVQGQTTGRPVDSKNVTAHLCPDLCTIGDQWSCVPPPCPLPPCVHPAKYKPTDCCSYCPDGADCNSPDGVPIKYNHWRIVSGKNCTCEYPPSDATCSKQL